MSEVQSPRRRRYFLFVVAWALLVALVGLVSGVGHVSVRGGVFLLMWLAPLVLGTTGVFVGTGQEARSWPKALIAMSLLATTPAYFVIGIPVQFLRVAMDPEYLSPWGTQGSMPPGASWGILLAWLGASAIAATVAVAASDIARWVFQQCGNRFNWLFAFPVYFASLVAFQLGTLFLLIAIEAVGLYPCQVWLVPYV